MNEFAEIALTLVLIFEFMKIYKQSQKLEKVGILGTQQK